MNYLDIRSEIWSTAWRDARSEVYCYLTYWHFFLLLLRTRYLELEQVDYLQIFLCVLRSYIVCLVWNKIINSSICLSLICTVFIYTWSISSNFVLFCFFSWQLSQNLKNYVVSWYHWCSLNNVFGLKSRCDIFGKKVLRFFKREWFVFNFTKLKENIFSIIFKTFDHNFRLHLILS